MEEEKASRKKAGIPSKRKSTGDREKDKKDKGRQSGMHG